MKTMKNYIAKFFAAAASICLLSVGCSVLSEDNGTVGGKREVKFSASVGSFQVKATDTEFEGGDAIGLFAFDPIYVNNVRLTFQDGALVPDEPVYWGGEQLMDQSTLFCAYYPFSLDRYDTHFVFDVQEDQSTHEAYTASDLMFASTYATPAQGEVNLNFVHKLAKLVLDIDNKLDSDPIAEVFLGNVYKTFSGYITEPDYLDWYGDKVYLKTAKGVNAAGETVWSVIVPPQYAEPSIMVITESGKEYVYQSTDGVAFFPSKRYSAHVVIDETSIATEFSATIHDWIDADEDFWFDQFNPRYNGEWTIIGSIGGSMWDKDFRMTRESRTLWTATIPYRTGNEFKFRMNYEWGIDFGLPRDTEVTVAEGETPLEEYGRNITLPKEGIWNITLDLKALCMYAYFQEEFPEVEGTLIWAGSQTLADWDYSYEVGSVYDWQGKDIQAGDEVLIYYKAIDGADYWEFYAMNPHWNYGVTYTSNEYAFESGHVSYYISSKNIYDFLNSDGWGGAMCFVGKGVIITAISLVQHAVEPEFEWDYYPSPAYLSDANLWRMVDYDHTISWFYAPNWSEIDAPDVTFTESTYEFTLPEATYDRWQAQMWIEPNFNFVLDANKQYYFSITVAATNWLEGFIKAYERGNDGNCSLEANFYASPDGASTYTWGPLYGIDAQTCILMDFGGAPARTKVYIKDITITEVEESIWSVIGTINDTNWDTDFVMEKVDYSQWGLTDEIWSLNIPYYFGQEFKFRKNEEWSVNLGYSGDGAYYDGGYCYLPLVQDGANITLPEEGEWQLTINVTQGYFEATLINSYGIQLSSIQDIVEAETGTEVDFTQVVYATSTRGFVLFDGKYSIFVYTGTAAPECNIGDVVRVQGTRGAYNGVPEILNSNLTYSVLSSSEIGEVWYQNITSYLDESIADISIPVELEGLLTLNGSEYRINVEGANGVGAAYYPIADLGLADLVNHNVKVRGFYNGRNGNVVYIIVTYVEDLGEVEVNEYVAEGDGTLENPYNATAAYEICAALENKATIEGVYVKGIISSIKSAYSVKYGTAIFNISDDGSVTAPQFQVYGAYYFNNASWTEDDYQIAVGDEVTVYGTIMNYNGTPETSNKNACLYELNGYRP